ncbi:MAG: agmatine deiminase family protein [Bryobacterales bacterium]|nr:agmatine deiminase family protein [Bryobacterales bacterium]
MVLANSNNTLPRLRMPAEWEPHEATWLAWPHERSDWPGKFAPVPWIYGDIVRHLSEVEKVRILVRDQKVRREAERCCVKSHARMENVEFYEVPTDRSWTRDFCPIFVKTSTGVTAITDWQFNGWAKYPNSLLDDGVPSFVAAALRMKRWQPKHRRRRIVLEGGSIDVNGAGMMLTTEECLLSEVQERNPGMLREDYEAVFHEWLGVEKVIWLRNGIAGDDTHGHVDDLARFVSEDTVVIASETNRGDTNFAPLAENLKILRAANNQRGDKLKVATLPMPAPVYFDGQRLPASYANFYIANGIVLVPVFNDPNDRVALNTIARVMPGHRVLPIYCRDLVLGLGTLHCMTQQQPLAG